MFQGEHSAILSTFIKLPFSIKTFVSFISEWPLKTGLTYLKYIILLVHIFTCIMYFLELSSQKEINLSI